MRLTSFILMPNRGFTLVETLLVLALLVLGAVLLLPAAGAVFRRARLANPEEEVMMVLQQARREAVLRGRQLNMHFDANAHRLVWEGAEGADFTAVLAGMEIDFLRPEPASAVLIGGRQVETSPLPAMRFFPDGTCDPVRLQLRTAEGSPRLMTIDPWTCAPGLEVKP